MEKVNLFFDTETTDFKPGQICQLAYILESNSEIKECKNFFFTVDKIEEGALSAHGMNEEYLRKVSNGKVFSDNADEIRADFSDARLIAHNEPFDERFITAEFSRCGTTLAVTERQCTMEFFKGMLKLPNTNTRYKGYKYPKLAEVIDFYNINPRKIETYSRRLFNYGDEGGSSFHDARYDTTAMFVAVNVYREIAQNGKQWQEVFCN